MTDAEFRQQIDKLVESYNNMKASMDKALNSRRNKVFTLFYRLASLLLFAACIYAGVMGFGGSALVLGTMFLLFWFIDRMSVAIVGGFTAYAQGKTKELELEAEKLSRRSG